MPSEKNFTPIFDQLKKILKEYEPEMVVKTDSSEQYYLDTHKINPVNNKIIFFAATIIKKNYVSFYLMPIYSYPELLNEIPDSLRKRMQGKSCFNFKAPDDDLFQELKILTNKGYQKYKEMDLI
ncbi:hypothetical protein PSTEL_16765 [Paenibacillus stellifer]|uniref:YdhG-like domain-containing protein n=1 Tax=Paenibacillus stellifer TaxID=169760 RepID=A0A089LSK1_9BACL|nr:hypothetical protein [Paenibacillus stellifer]AIQ64506.1 hypothetical protein PSTEL_16765 [Paenibacillus stellifer]